MAKAKGNFAGTLVRDRYAAYNGIGVDWQVCIAHIITKAKEISAEHALLPETEKDAATGPFCDRSGIYVHDSATWGRS